MSEQLPLEIEELHNHAIYNQEMTYTDPSTQFTVFTEYAHLKRGKCCGSMCRHCPYGWENVRYDHGGTRISKLKNGDRDHANQLLEEMKVEGERRKARDAFVSAPPKEVILEYEKNDIGTKDKKKSGGRHGGIYTDKNVPYTRGGDKGTSQLFTGERRPKNNVVFEAMGTVDELCCFVGVAHSELMHSMENIDRNEVMNNNIDKVLECEEQAEIGDGRYGELPIWLLDVMSRLFDVGSHIAKPTSMERTHNNRNKNNMKRNANKPRLPYKRTSHVDTDSTDEDDSDSTDSSLSYHSSSDEEEQLSEKNNNNAYNGIGGNFNPAHVSDLEHWIDIMTQALPELNSFILPSGGRISSQFHVCRTVCRRAERLCVGLVDPDYIEQLQEGDVYDGYDAEVNRYLNRLSDFFFTAARYVNYCDGRDEIVYKRYFKGDKQRGRVLVSLKKNEEEG